MTTDSDNTPNTPEPVKQITTQPSRQDPHYQFYKGLILGERVFRNDLANSKTGWLDLKSPEIAGNACNIQRFGYGDLTLERDHPGKGPFRKPVDVDLQMELVELFENPQAAVSPEARDLANQFEALSDRQFVRALNTNPELRQATDRGIPLPVFKDLAPFFPGAAILALAGSEDKGELPEGSFDEEVHFLIENTSGLRFLDVLKAMPAMNDDQHKACLLREPLAALYLGVDYLEPETLIPAFHAVREELDAAWTHRESSMVSTIFEIVATASGSDQIRDTPEDFNQPFRTQEELQEAAKFNPGLALQHQALFTGKQAITGNPPVLSPEQTEACARARPDVALTYALLLRNHLSPDCLSECALTNRRTRQQTLRTGPPGVSPKTYVSCANRERTTAIEVLSGNPPKNLLHALHTNKKRTHTALHKLTEDAVGRYLGGTVATPKKDPKKDPEPKI